MSKRNEAAVCHSCRALNAKLFLKGEKCYIDDKCPEKRRSYPPGHMGRASRRFRNATDYATQLREKQKARVIYGVSERQFRNYYKAAVRLKGVTGEVLMRLLESRLDNVVYRMGFAPSRAAARQFVGHGLVLVNGKKVNIPSYIIKVDDEVSIREKQRKNPIIMESANLAAQRGRIPAWIQANPLELKGAVVELPSRGKIDTDVNEQLIVEFYSR